MSKKNKVEYSETTLVKRKKEKTNTWDTVKGFLFGGGCLALVICFAILFSNLLTVGKFSLVFNQHKSEWMLEESYYYAVMLGEYETEAEANSVGTGASTMGASGYVMKLDGKYYVFGNVYKKESDAKSVKDNITASSNYKAFVKKLVFKKVEIKLPDYTNEQNGVLVDALKFFDKLLDKIYDSIILLDKQETTYTRVSSEINTLKSEAKIIESKLDAINSTNVNEKTMLIKNSYVNLIDVVDNLILNLISSKNSNHLTKYAYCNIIQIKFDLFKSL